MKTAQDYLNGLDKEAVMTIASKLGLGVSKLFGNNAGKYVGRQAAKATGKVDKLYKNYKGTNAYKNYGNAPLYAAGGVAAGGIVL